jgi:hypothetical protein
LGKQWGIGSEKENVENITKIVENIMQNVENTIINVENIMQNVENMSLFVAINSVTVMMPGQFAVNKTKNKLLPPHMSTFNYQQEELSVTT